MFMCKIRVWELFLEENMCIELPRECSAKESACNNRRHKRHGFDLRGREDAPEKEMATYSSILPWEIPWTDEPGGLQSMESRRVGSDGADRQTCIEKKVV